MQINAAAAANRNVPNILRFRIALPPDLARLLLRQLLICRFRIGRERRWVGAWHFAEGLLHLIKRFALLHQLCNACALRFGVLQICLNLCLRFRRSVTKHIGIGIKLRQRGDEPDPALRLAVLVAMDQADPPARSDRRR